MKGRQEIWRAVPSKSSQPSIFNNLLQSPSKETSAHPWRVRFHELAFCLARRLHQAGPSQEPSGGLPPRGHHHPKLQAFGQTAGRNPLESGFLISEIIGMVLLAQLLHLNHRSRAALPKNVFSSPKARPRTPPPAKAKAKAKAAPDFDVTNDWDWELRHVLVAARTRAILATHWVCPTCSEPSKVPFYLGIYHIGLRGTYLQDFERGIGHRSTTTSGATAASESTGSRTSEGDYSTFPVDRQQPPSSCFGWLRHPQDQAAHPAVEFVEYLESVHNPFLGPNLGVVPEQEFRRRIRGHLLAMDLRALLQLPGRHRPRLQVEDPCECRLPSAQTRSRTVTLNHPSQRPIQQPGKIESALS